MTDLDPEMCAQVYVDWEYRKIWDSYVLGEFSIVHRTPPFWASRLLPDSGTQCCISIMLRFFV